MNLLSSPQSQLVSALLLVLLCMATVLPAQAAPASDPCAHGVQAVLDRFQREQREFEPAIDALTNKPAVPTEELVPVGTRNLRQYRARLEHICQEAAERDRAAPDRACASKLLPGYQDAAQGCLAYVDIEMDYQWAVFEQAMLLDATRKRVTFLVRKYKELNEKFSALLNVVVGVRNGLAGLNRKVDAVAEMCETGQ